MKTPINSAIDYFTENIKGNNLNASERKLSKAQKKQYAIINQTLGQVVKHLASLLPAQRHAIEEAYKTGAEHESNYGDIPGWKAPDSEKYFNDKYDG
jgi:hypothetical protein